MPARLLRGDGHPRPGLRYQVEMQIRVSERLRGFDGRIVRRRVAGLALFLPAVEQHADHERERAQIHDGRDDDVRDVFVIRREVGQLRARMSSTDMKMAEDDGNGVVDREQGNRDAVEALGRSVWYVLQKNSVLPDR